MNRLRVTAVSAILLASNLSHGLARWANLVDHSILGLTFSNTCPDYDHLFLRYPDRLVTPGTEITAQFEPLNERTVLGSPLPFCNARASDPSQSSA
jgi:hypothetical protein